jgi:hypothetical protein
MLKHATMPSVPAEAGKRFHAAFANEMDDERLSSSADRRSTSELFPTMATESDEPVASDTSEPNELAIVGHRDA